MDFIRTDNIKFININNKNVITFRLLNYSNNYVSRTLTHIEIRDMKLTERTTKKAIRFTVYNNLIYTINSIIAPKLVSGKIEIFRFETDNRYKLWVDDVFCFANIPIYNSLLSIRSESRDYLGTIKPKGVNVRDYSFMYSKDTSNENTKYALIEFVVSLSNKPGEVFIIDLLIDSVIVYTFGHCVYFMVLSEPISGSNECLINVNGVNIMFNLDSFISIYVDNVPNIRSWCGDSLFMGMILAISPRKILLINNKESHVVVDDYVFLKCGIKWKIGDKYYIGAIIPYSENPLGARIIQISITETQYNIDLSVDLFSCLVEVLVNRITTFSIIYPKLTFKQVDISTALNTNAIMYRDKLFFGFNIFVCNTRELAFMTNSETREVFILDYSSDKIKNLTKSLNKVRGIATFLDFDDLLLYNVLY